ncbi:DnaJ homolog subfamily C member 17, partial [Durusdinium trenchii]
PSDRRVLPSRHSPASSMGEGGAVGKGKEDDLDNAYELLELEDDAGEKEIKTAYRKISLKCHPDRNPDDEEAAEKFDRLTRAKDLLLDPIRRSELDRKRKAAKDLEERHAQEDAKRRKLREDLEGRESMANARSQAYRRAQEDAEARKKYLQQDMAQRIKAKEEELARKQQE